MKREPSCELNHDKMRKELRNKGIPSASCPNCSWILRPAKDDELQVTKEDIREHVRDLLIEWGVIEGEE